jgi:hypothetical protein
MTTRLTEAVYCRNGILSFKIILCVTIVVLSLAVKVAKVDMLRWWILTLNRGLACGARNNSGYLKTRLLNMAETLLGGISGQILEVKDSR